jgi:hypothetical protein
MALRSSPALQAIFEQAKEPNDEAAFVFAVRFLDLIHKINFAHEYLTFPQKMPAELEKKSRTMDLAVQICPTLCRHRLWRLDSIKFSGGRFPFTRLSS